MYYQISLQTSTTIDILSNMQATYQYMLKQINKITYFKILDGIHCYHIQP